MGWDARCCFIGGYIVKKYYIDDAILQKLDVICDLIEYACGCLLDNYVYYCDTFTAFIFEEYQSTNASNNIMYLVSNDDKQNLSKLWGEFELLTV